MNIDELFFCPPHALKRIGNTDDHFWTKFWKHKIVFFSDKFSKYSETSRPPDPLSLDAQQLYSAKHNLQ